MARRRNNNTYVEDCAGRLLIQCKNGKYGELVQDCDGVKFRYTTPSGYVRGTNKRYWNEDDEW